MESRLMVGWMSKYQWCSAAYLKSGHILKKIVLVTNSLMILMILTTFMMTQVFPSATTIIHIWTVSHLLIQPLLTANWYMTAFFSHAMWRAWGSPSTKCSTTPSGTFARLWWLVALRESSTIWSCWSPIHPQSNAHWQDQQSSQHMDHLSSSSPQCASFQRS